MANLKVAMRPHLDRLGTHESGIARVVQAYFKHLPDYGVSLSAPESSDFDIRVSHAGVTGHECDVSHLHGLYWTADYYASNWEYAANAGVVDSIRHAKEVTVPSSWVAETLQRDMRINPHVIAHGIDVDDWTPRAHKKYILWNKNRNADVCDPTPMVELAKRAENIQFVTTQMPLNHVGKISNINEIGLQSHKIMKKYIEEAGVYLSTTKETFGIGVLEAMASGVPVLGFDWGGNQALVKHSINGYLARSHDIDDLLEGLQYCIKYRDTLGANGRDMAKKWLWETVVEQVAGVYRLATESHPYENQVSVVIPVYNYAKTLERAVKSVLEQRYPALEIIIVDDGSTDDTRTVGERLAEQYESVRYILQDNNGVAIARNRGIELSHGEYISCLDADDQIAPEFLLVCIEELKKDRSLGIAYTGLYRVVHDEEGNRIEEGLSKWPEEFDADKHLTPRSSGNLRGLNQIPTCCVFRKEAWRRTGGYKSRYAPLGAGSEDAEFWARIISIGYDAKKVTRAGHFIYSDLTGQVTSGHKRKEDPNLIEPMWLSMHPWAEDHQHPFASRATPANKKASHPVRQYDEPMVSVIIPVGPGHEEDVKNALDSLESQTYRQWEAIVVNDTGKPLSHKFDAYPYIRWITTVERKAHSDNSINLNESLMFAGAGFARNRGAEIARAPFLIFLDADDSLAPDFISKTLRTWEELGNVKSIIYTDYYNKFYTTEEDVQNFPQENIIRFIPKTGETLMVGQSANFDCERAQMQPVFNKLYHWCLVTCLIPKLWHDAVGGFDESMESFEDVLYHWKLARLGYCYTRIEEPLIVYRMYTGNRREKASVYTPEGRKVAASMLQYSQKELERIEPVACQKCPGNKTQSSQPVNVMQELAQITGIREFAESGNQGVQSVDDKMVTIRYKHPNIGNHMVIGRATGTKYGYRGGGAVFDVHIDDIRAASNLFEIIENPQVPDEILPQKQSPPPQLLESPPPPPLEVVAEEVKVESVATMVIEDTEALLPATPPPVPLPDAEPLPGPEVEEEEEEEEMTTVEVSSSVHPDIVTRVEMPKKEAEKLTEDMKMLSEMSPEEIEATKKLVDDKRKEEEEVEFTFVGDNDPAVDLDALPGISPGIAQQLRERGVVTKAQILQLGVEGLQLLRGIGEKRAEIIITSLAQDYHARNK